MATNLMDITVLWKSGPPDAMEHFMKLRSPQNTGIKEEDFQVHAIKLYT